MIFAITNPVIDPKIGGGIPGANVISPLFNDPASPLVTYLVNFLRVGFVAGIVIFLFMLLIGAVEYITAGGEKEKASNAAKRITNAVTGFVILFSLFAIAWLISLVFGINILKIVIPTLI